MPRPANDQTEPTKPKPMSSRKRFGTFREGMGQKGWNKRYLGSRRFSRLVPHDQQMDDLSPQERKDRRKRYMKQYRDWLWPHRWGLGLVLGLAIIVMPLELVTPAASGLIIDKILLADGIERSEKLRMINMAGLGLLGLLLLARAIETTRSYYMAILTNMVIFRLRKRLHHRMLRLPLDRLQAFKTGGIVARLSGDVDQVMGLLQTAIFSPVVALIRIIGVMVVLVVWNWQLALAALVIIPPAVFVSFAYIRRIRPVYRAAWEDRSQVDARVTESFGGLRVVRSFRREQREQREYAVGHHTMIRKRMLARILEMIINVVWDLITPIIVLAILWVGGVLYLSNRAEIGQILAFQLYAGMLMMPIYRIIFSLSSLQRSLAAMDRVFEVLELDEDKPDAPDAVPAPVPIESIELRHVGFEYDQGKPVLHNINLHIAGGSTVALVGASGAGKSTMADLIARFHDPTQGEILLNGIDLRKLKLASFRRLLAIVQQDVFLFDGSIRDNIAYGRQHATDQQVIAAAKRANAHEFIEKLEHGYDAFIGERGVRLSGGQRQRLSIARAILADPDLLILDEATSNLDTESEQLIQTALADLYSNRTTIVIAHRLSTIQHADLIVVIDDGRVIETGTHVQLMRVDGMYAEMVNRQSRHIAVDDVIEA